MVNINCVTLVYIQHFQTHLGAEFMQKMNKKQKHHNNLWLKCTSWMKTLAKRRYVWYALCHAKSLKAGKSGKLSNTYTHKDDKVPTIKNNDDFTEILQVNAC